MALVQRQTHSLPMGSLGSLSSAWPVQQHRACAWRGASQGCRHRRHAVRTAALSEFFKDFFDFNTWAPKSSRVWRLQQWEPGTDNSPTEADRIEADSMQTLNERINQLRDPSSDASSRSSSTTSSTAGGGSVATLDPGSALGPAERSFSEVGDADIAEALASRLRAAALASGESFAGAAAAEQIKPLTGQEIRELLLKKWGKSYDISFVRRDMPGKTFVSMNIMWLHLEQRSFKMTPEQYMEKLDGVAALVSVLGQTNKVRAFLNAPARSQKGLPRRPVVGTAISIQFDLPQAVIEEWWGTRGGL